MNSDGLYKRVEKSEKNFFGGFGCWGTGNTPHFDLRSLKSAFVYAITYLLTSR